MLAETCCLLSALLILCVITLKNRSVKLARPLHFHLSLLFTPSFSVAFGTGVCVVISNGIGRVSYLISYLWQVHFYQFPASSVTVINRDDLHNFSKLHIFCLFWHGDSDSLFGEKERKAKNSRELLGLEPVSLMTKKSRLRWFGHVENRRYRLREMPYRYSTKTTHNEAFK